MFLFLIFVIGLFVGSFLNVIVDRLPRKETILKGRSHCESCKKELAWNDLIPLLSFLILKGQCRYCKAKLSLLYPIIELTTGILFVFTFVFIISNSQFLISNQTFTINLLYYLFLICSFIIIFFTDLKYGVIPDKIVFSAILVTSLFLAFNFKLSTFNFLFSAFGTCAFFLLLFLITKGKGMGFGDVKLAFLLGLILGFPKIVLALYIAFLTGAILGSILILWRKKRSLKDTIPFGPFLIMGAFLALFYGNALIPKIIIFLGLQ